VSARAGAVLDRFPRHLDVDGRGKVVGHVVEALAADLDVASSQLGRIQRAHALGRADERGDLARLARLHGLPAVGLLERRLAAVRAVVDGLGPPEPGVEHEALDDLSERLGELLGLPAEAVALVAGEGDERARRERLAVALSGLLRHATELDRRRALVVDLVRAHRLGNGSVRSLLVAAAAHLHLAPEGDLAHSDDRYWHVLTGRDLLRVARPGPPGQRPPSTELVPAEDVVALEENPLRSAEVLPAPRRHGELFSVIRRGFEEVVVAVLVRGIEDRTVAPMIVNVDTGAGSAFVAAVPEESELRFERDGRVLLDGGDAAGLAYGFHGAVFADADGPHRNDFLWAEPDGSGLQVATFAVTAPVSDAFEATASFPHSSMRLETQRASTGVSRWVLFIGEGAFAAEVEGGAPLVVAPHFGQATFDASVYADAVAAPPPAAAVGFAWLEREPFAARLWIPRRFAALDTDPADVPVREQLRLALEPHRPAGVHLYVEHSDDRWVMGEGVLRDPGSAAARGVVVAGTRLWSSPEPEPN
jgi:hypothetical protein